MVYRLFLMITLGGAGPVKGFCKGGFKEIDQVSIFEKVSATFRPTFAHQYPQVVSHAFRISQCSGQGLFILIVMKMFYMKKLIKMIPLNQLDQIYPHLMWRSRNDKSIDLLRNSNSPIIFAGGGLFGQILLRIKRIH